MAQNPKNQATPQATPAILLDCKFTPDEASLILTKLNTAQFMGFGESSMALSILGKIQNASKIPAAAIGPTVTQTNNIKDSKPSDISQLRQVLGKTPEKPVVEEKARNVSFTPPPAATETPVTEVDEDEEDSRPGPPLKALDEAKAETTKEADPAIPPDDAPAFGVIDNSKKKDGTDKYI